MKYKNVLRLEDSEGCVNRIRQHVDLVLSLLDLLGLRQALDAPAHRNGQADLPQRSLHALVFLKLWLFCVVPDLNRGEHQRILQHNENVKRN